MAHTTSLRPIPREVWVTWLLREAQAVEAFNATAFAAGASPDPRLVQMSPKAARELANLLVTLHA